MNDDGVDLTTFDEKYARNTCKLVMDDPRTPKIIQSEMKSRSQDLLSRCLDARCVFVRFEKIVPIVRFGFVFFSVKL